MNRWKLVYDESAHEFIGGQRGNRLRRLRVLLETIADHPTFHPDAFCRGPDGRPYAIRRTADFTITYWLDVWVKEVRVISIERNPGK